jgi:very-short-patch-repair endonuclease
MKASDLTPNPSPKERGKNSSLSFGSGLQGEVPRYLTANTKHYKFLKENQEYLKSNMTTAEKILWQRIRNKKLGYKFRRQHIIDTFIVDFVCLKTNLIIEVDGKIHIYQKDYDSNRTDVLEDLGYRVIRFTNAEVLNNLNEVVSKIKSTLPLL